MFSSVIDINNHPLCMHACMRNILCVCVCVCVQFLCNPGKIHVSSMIFIHHMTKLNGSWDGTSQPSDAQSIGRQGGREVPDILSWITCFGMYASVLCDKYLDKVWQMFVYQAFMVREARHCGGKGWLAYDMMFWQQAANNPKADWITPSTPPHFWPNR